MELKVGQRWRTRGGYAAVVEALNDGRSIVAAQFPFLVRAWPMGTDMDSCTGTVDAEGRVFGKDGPHSIGDLLTLVEDVVTTSGEVRMVLSARVEFPQSPAPAAGIGDVNSTEKGSGARYNTGKTPYELVPLSIIGEARMLHAEPSQVDLCMALCALGRWQEHQGREHLIEAIYMLGFEGFQEAARVFDYGRRKYAEWNWAKGMKWSAPLACAARHILAMLDEGDTDLESGLSHRGHAICNVVMLLTYEFTFPEGDDRPAAGLLWIEPQPKIDFERKRAEDTEGGAL